MELGSSPSRVSLGTDLCALGRHRVFAVRTGGRSTHPRPPRCQPGVDRSGPGQSQPPVLGGHARHRHHCQNGHQHQEWCAVCPCGRGAFTHPRGRCVGGCDLGQTSAFGVLVSHFDDGGLEHGRVASVGAIGSISNTLSHHVFGRLLAHGVRRFEHRGASGFGLGHDHLYLPHFRTHPTRAHARERTPSPLAASPAHPRAVHPPRG